MMCAFVMVKSPVKNSDRQLDVEDISPLNSPMPLLLHHAGQLFLSHASVLIITQTSMSVYFESWTCEMRLDGTEREES